MSPSFPQSVAPVILNNTANLELKSNPILIKTRITACTPKYIVQSCSCGRTLTPSTCMALSCKNCAPWTGKRRAFSIFNRLRAAENTRQSNIIYTVLTVPEILRARFADPKKWTLLRKRAWHILKNRFGAKFGVECSHPIGSRNENFHPHLNFLWVQSKGYDPYISVVSLRSAWAKILKTESVEVHTQYTQSPKRIMHWSKYVSRVFPGYHYWTGSIRWFGKYPKSEKYEPCTCGVCGETFKAVGTILASEVDNYFKYGWSLGIDPPWYNDKNITHFRKSKKC